VRPQYPESARQEYKQGQVILGATISETGCVVRAAVLRTVDLRLDWEAMRAVLGWKFTPTHLEGKPVPVVMTVTVQFSLK
jgi:protein TonB